MEKFYVASSLRNVNAVRYITNQLIDRGYLHTYDWTQNTNTKQEQTPTLESLREIGEYEMKAVSESDLVIVLLPGGKGTHIEMGIALGLGKRIFLYSEEGAINNVETTSTFYHLPEVEKCFGTLDSLVAKIDASRVLQDEFSN